MRYTVISYVYFGGIEIVRKFFSKKKAYDYIEFIDKKENAHVIFEVKKRKYK